MFICSYAVHNLYDIHGITRIHDYIHKVKLIYEIHENIIPPPNVHHKCMQIQINFLKIPIKNFWL